MQMNRAYSMKDVHENWHEYVVIIWEEDDARPPDRETGPEALARISNSKRTQENPLARSDQGDMIFCLMSGGWVLGFSPEGNFVGILTKGGTRC